jgi:hypothetical protein
MNNMDDEKDLLQIKIDNARAELSENTLAAIKAVDWRASILEARVKKGYSIDQLEELEAETELVLCGLTPPADYPRNLEKKMGISKAQANDLVNYMNTQVFSKIKEALIRRTTPKEAVKANEGSGSPTPNDTQILKSSGIEIVPEKLELNTPQPKEIRSILAQKLSGFSKNDVVRTEHALENITKSSDTPVKPTSPDTAPSPYPKNADPYRLRPE